MQRQVGIKKSKNMIQKQPKETHIELTDKQKRFCEEYVIDWNGTRAAIKAGYSENSARQIATETLSKPYIQAYIAEIQKDLQKLSGISALRNLLELRDIAYAPLDNFKEEGETENNVKCKLNDKIKAIEVINRMLGFNDAEKIDHTTKNEKIQPTIIAAPEVAESIQKLMQKFDEEPNQTEI